MYKRSISYAAVPVKIQRMLLPCILFMPNLAMIQILHLLVLWYRLKIKFTKIFALQFTAK